MTSNLRLWKFHLDCGRMGELNGLFAATKDEVDNVIGREVYFGEVLGKHSEIDGDMCDDNFEMLDIDPDIVKILVKAVGNDTISGYNPLDYVENDEEY